MLPEMKGFSLEQLDYLFNSRVPTRKFASYVFADSVLAIQGKDIENTNKEESDKKPHEETVELKA